MTHGILLGSCTRHFLTIKIQRLKEFIKKVSQRQRKRCVIKTLRCLRSKRILALANPSETWKGHSPHPECHVVDWVPAFLAFTLCSQNANVTTETFRGSGVQIQQTGTH